MSQRAAGLYLHIPFCSRVCPYCDFAVRTGDAARRRRYVDHLIAEIELYRGLPLRYDTIYFGGGTPSQLDPRGVREVFETLRALVSERGTTVVLATHKLEWLAVFADRVVALSEGKVIAEGDPQSVLTDPILAQHSISTTRYTQAAQQALESGWISSEEQLPVTLEQAVRFFDAD